tara:strand:+ start:520 stop:660 length:141 start_codon:yes stop_codon:yes gene_type:complete
LTAGNITAQHTALLYSEYRRVIVSGYRDAEFPQAGEKIGRGSCQDC